MRTHFTSIFCGSYIDWCELVASRKTDLRLYFFSCFLYISFSFSLLSFPLFLFFLFRLLSFLLSCLPLLLLLLFLHCPPLPPPIQPIPFFLFSLSTLSLPLSLSLTPIYFKRLLWKLIARVSKNGFLRLVVQFCKASVL